MGMIKFIYSLFMWVFGRFVLALIISYILALLPIIGPFLGAITFFYIIFLAKLPTLI